jgi:purine-cytosine permease-like protein
MNKVLKIAGDTFNFIKKWSDVLIVLPITAALVITNTAWARYIDPTSNVLDAGFIVVLNFNILKFMAIMILSYFIFQNFFRGDIFHDGWEKKIKNPVHAAVISVALWISVLVVAFFTITKDL